MISRALVADDAASDREVMQEILHTVDGEIEVLTAEDGKQACRMLEETGFDVVFTDLRMPGKGGLEVLRKAREGRPPSDVVVVTGHGDVRSAVEAIKSGGFDYLLKPISADEVELLLQKLREHRRLVQENRYLHAELAGGNGDRDIIGESEVMQEACAQARQVARTDATILLQGESGTGKELVSRLIHAVSPRSDGPFIRVNCAALSEALLESELFGHEKGAFTGAHSSKPGRFELADGGTLLLDEISETSDKLQAELLRVIEQKEFERVGGTKTLKVDIRFIATTNRDLAEEVEEGRFRQDLYYRLNVVPLLLPPLREREGDIKVLATYFARKFARRLGRDCPRVEQEVFQIFRRYPWPGNVRELENLLQRLIIMDGDGHIGPEDLPEYVRTPRGRQLTDAPWGPTLEDVERQVILATLRETDGNRTRAAERLDISTRTIRNKLKKYRDEGYIDENFS